ncbi:MAG: hypothetical protein IJD35_00055, partial [Clostridia bacterium]|nr:hypothetical protein [Clostridia bacterium]
YAVWDECDHTEQVKFVFKQNGSDSVICTCQCAYTVTMLLKAPSGAVYDGQRHAATPQFTHSHDEFTQNMIDAFQNLSIVYTGVATEPINAGEYTATVTVNGLPLYVVYNIAKKAQAAPEKPTFEASGGNLTVNPPVRVMGDAGTQIHYQLVHKEADGDSVPTAWQTNLNFSDFDESWTLYYVVAYYPGNDNYLDSSEVVSDQKYIYEGKIEIIIVNGDGFASTLPVGGGEGEAVRLVSTPLDAFYLTSAYKATITGELKKGDQELSSDEIATHFQIHAGPGEFYYTIISFEGTVEGKITIAFEGAKQKATVTPSVAPNERFDDITGVQTEIANNSAFTAYFDVKYFDSAVYTDLSLRFNRNLPVGTTLIMLNKADHKLWYVTVTTPTAVIAISEFQPMGGGSGTLAMNDLLQYQFVVDFSDTENMDNGELTMWFTATNNDSQYAPELPNLAATVLLKEITPTFSEPAVNQNSASIEMQYAEKTDNASKWNDREVALVLIPDDATKTKLPIDAAIEVIETVEGQTKSQTYTRLDDGSFIVVLNRNASDFKIVLRSQMFKTAEYTFALYYYAAYEGSAPMNGIELERATMTLHSVEKAQNSALITVDGDSRVYDMNSGVIKASIQTEVKEGYTATVTLMRKNSDGEYVSTAWSEDLESGTKEIEIQNLSSFSEGIFALTVVVREETSNTAVLEVSHYFIIQK